MRFDPFREFDRLSQEAFGSLSMRSPVLAMDAYRDTDRFVVHFDVPGVDPANLDLTVDKNVLTVSAERTPALHEGTDVVASERPHGKFQRQLFLGENLDTDHIDASYTNGVLTVHIPVAEQAKPRRVEITEATGHM